MYGASKLASDKLFIAGNHYSGDYGTRFSVVRYGNVMGSRGSVIPLFLKLRSSKTLPITHKNMTRFMISLEDAVELVWNAFEDMTGGEIYVKKIPSMKVLDIAKSVGPECSHEIIGIRPGEKMHEQMISAEDSYFTYEYENYYKVLPNLFDWADDVNRIKNGVLVPEGFSYTSENNTSWMSVDVLNDWLDEHKDEIGTI